MYHAICDPELCNACNPTRRSEVETTYLTQSLEAIQKEREKEITRNQDTSRNNERAETTCATCDGAFFKDQEVMVI